MEKIREVINWILYGKYEDKYLDLMEVFMFVFYGWLLIPFRIITNLLNSNKQK